MPVVRIALAQINTIVGDFKGNLTKIALGIEQARSVHADLVTFPELALCGYPPEDLLIKQRFLKDSLTALENLKTHCRGINVIVGCPNEVRGDVYNAAALLADGELRNVYYKIELPNYGVFDEKRYFRPGSGCTVFDIAGMRFSMSICEDIWIPGSLVESCSVRNAVQVTLNIAASPYHAGKQHMRRDIITRFAAATDTVLCFNNLVGGQDELVFDGGSFVAAPTGEILFSARRFEEDLLVADLEFIAPPAREATWHLRGPCMELQAYGTGSRSSLPRSLAKDPDPAEEVYKALVLGTRDYVLKNGFKKAVLGLSGGVDSSLVACVAADALGAESVVGVTMPSQYTSQGTFSDATTLAENLGIEIITIPIRDVLDAYSAVLDGPFGDGPPGVEYENLQARIRGNILMALSNRFGLLVLTTGNKSETAVGYCTLYGDMAGGFAVIKDVPKTLVYELADYANRKAGKEIIPRSVIERAPSAELRPDQKDEDSLPPYALLDRILKEYVEEDKAAGEIQGVDPAVVRDVVRMVDLNEYKRRQAPPGVKITPKAFGRDRRLPITNRYRDGSLEE